MRSAEKFGCDILSDANPLIGFLLKKKAITVKFIILNVILSVLWKND